MEGEEVCQRQSWHRACPRSVEVRPCLDPGRGNGLFAHRSFTPGDVLFEEDPVSGLALLMFDEAQCSKHCSNCTQRLPPRGLPTSASLPSCTSGCGAVYCSEGCRQDAWQVHHEVLCPAVNEAWAAFEQHAKDCANEYYVLAARALASLRHDPPLGPSAGSCGGGLDAPPAASSSSPCTKPPVSNSRAWLAAPWAGYASKPWWETMRRPRYESSSSSCSSRSSGGDSRRRGRAEKKEEGQRERGDAKSLKRGEESRRHGSSDSGSNSSSKGGSGEEEGSQASSSPSLDRFFQAKVREQTAETAAMLLAALGGALTKGGVAERLLLSSSAGGGAGGCIAAAARAAEGGGGHEAAAAVGTVAEGEEFGHLVGLLRVNALSVQAAALSLRAAQQEVAPLMGAVADNHVATSVRGMAIYAVTSAMNHAADANCFVASDPHFPRRCSVQASRHIDAGEELCIDYLEGAAYDAGERLAILRVQYSIQ